jgi:hypothetical protein
MNGETQDEPEKSSRGTDWVWLCWLAGIVVYVLSTGPFVMMVDKGIIRIDGPVHRALLTAYALIFWADEETVLYKPLGLYWHLWIPEIVDSQGHSIRR